MGLTDTPPSHENSRLYDLPAAAGGQRTARFAPAPPGSLAGSWADPGVVFLFIRTDERVPDDDTLTGALRRFLAEPVNRGVRLLWIDNPADPLIRWRTSTLALEPHEGQWRLRKKSYIDLRNYALFLDRHTPATFDTGSEAVLLHRAGSAGRFALSTAYGAHRLTGLSDTVTLPLTGEAAGCLRFGLGVDKAGSPVTGFGYPDLPRLDAGFRIFLRDPAVPDAPGPALLSSHRYPLLSETCRNPRAWPYYPDRIEFGVSLHPLFPLAPGRSYAGIRPPDGRWAPLGVPSALRTPLGYTVHLRGRDAPAGLVFAERPTQLPDSSPADLYLTPAGDFELLTPHYHDTFSVDVSPTDRLICGLSAVEYVRLPPGGWIRFRPGFPAFADAYSSSAALLRELPALLEPFSEPLPDTPDPGLDLEADLNITAAERLALLERLRLDYFPPGHLFDEAARAEFLALARLGELTGWLGRALRQSGPAPGGALPALAAYPTTAWCSFGSPGQPPPVYYAQPDEAVLHSADAGSRTFLDYLEAPASALPADGEVTFPLLPYGDADGRLLSDMRELEALRIANLRRRRIYEGGRADTLPTAAGDDRTGATPQGLLASFTADFRTWQRLLLAVDTAGNHLQLTNIDPASPLRAALQSNRLCLVASDPASLHPYFRGNTGAVPALNDNQLNIQDWIFELGPGLDAPGAGQAPPDFWARTGTIFIAKFHEKSLLELAADPTLWAMPDAFNTDIDATRLRLRDVLEEAVRGGASDDPKERRKFEALARAAGNAAWNGILALNVAVPPGNLPDELKGLAAGIDADRFYAHHVGIDATPIRSEAGTLIPQPSSLFGLIDYRNDEPPPPHESGYNYHVRLLSVVFDNSLVKDFAAEVVITLDRLFDEATALRNSPDGRNIVVLKGTAENHGGRPVYSFSHSGDNRFATPGSEALHEVRIVRAGFSTDRVTADRTDASFQFWGRLNFRRLERCDVLSFGQEEPPTADDDRFLSFANLRLALSFSTPVFNPADTRTFTFDPGGMTFDLPRSRVRAQSLYAKFPLRLRGLLYSGATPRPIDELGYMPVRTPLGGAKPEGVWYALAFDLDLGGLGALAGKGNLIVSLLAAWRPGPEPGGVYVGLRLPGSTGGKKEITIQGVLKIAFKSIQLVVDHSTPGRTGYLLKLKNIVLRFFVLSFPPNAQTEIILFGDPDANPDGAVRDEERTVGWYAAYAKKLTS